MTITNRLQDENGPLFKTLKNTEGLMANLETVSADIRDGKGSVGGLLRSEELLKKIYTELDRLDNIMADVEDTTPAMLADIKTSIDQIKKTISQYRKRKPRGPRRDPLHKKGHQGNT